MRQRNACDAPSARLDFARRLASAVYNQGVLLGGLALKSVRGLWLLLLAGAGCTSASRRTADAPPPDAPEPRAIVFVVNGAGDFRGLSTSLRSLTYQDRLPLHVQTLEWSHGYSRIFADHLDTEHSRREGQKLAEQIVCYRRDLATALPVYLVAHSAGSMPTLAATEFLPPDSIERIILLAPSVSENYDLRPALRSAKQGMDVFYSRSDRTYLGLGMAIVGTADGERAAASGRVGFRVPSEADDGGLHTRLHQHPWEPSLSWTGYTGGHFSVYEVKFLRAYVAPLLTP